MSYPSQGDPYRIYREQQVGALGTGRLVLLALDTALRACRTGQRGLLARVLEELMAGLDLTQGEVATGLLRIYEYLLRQARDGRTAEVEKILLELRGAWESAVEAEEAASARRPRTPALAEPG